MTQEELKRLRQRKAIEDANKKRWLAVNPNLPERSGIYIMLREENGERFSYVGQAKHILTRLAQHLVGHQRIDISLKAHGLYSVDNPHGWKVSFNEYSESELDEQERWWIAHYEMIGFQTRNVTSGGQNAGKHDISERKQPKGYARGRENGYKAARQFIAKLFEKNLKAEINGKETATKQKAMQKFNDFISIDDENEDNEE